MRPPWEFAVPDNARDRLTLLLPSHGWRLAYSDSVARVYVRD